MVSGGVAALALVCVITAAVLLSGGPAKSTKGNTPGAGTHSKQHHKTPPSSTVTTTTAKPTVLEPESSTAGLVTFKVSKGPYIVTFTAAAAGACWIGVETGVGTGVYLWMQTISPGQTGTYDAKGPVAVVLGAPGNITVRVNGVPAKLPAVSTSYDIAFATT